MTEELPQVEEYFYYQIILRGDMKTKKPQQLRGCRNEYH